MKCFTHREADAIGICVRCGRGVCPACVVAKDESLACGPGCAAAIETARGLVRRSSGLGRATHRTQAVCLLVLAVLVGIAAALEDGVGRVVLGILAFLLLLAALRFFRLASMWKDGPGAGT